MIDRRVIHLGGVDYEVRPMEGVLQGYEVWRGAVELGFFTVNEDGKVEVSPSTPDQVDEVMLRLVATEYVRPIR